MADAKEVLDMMKDVAKSRIRMLKEGVTFHDAVKKDYYLREYESKLRDIEQLRRRLNLRLAHTGKDGRQTDKPDQPRRGKPNRKKGPVRAFSFINLIFSPVILYTVCNLRPGGCPQPSALP